MFNDFPVVSNYDRLSAQFHVGRSTLIEMVGFMSVFLNFLLEQLLKVVSISLLYQLEFFIFISISPSLKDLKNIRNLKILTIF